MSNTHDYNIGDAVGATFRADLNVCLSEIQATNRGSSAPSTLVNGKLWVNSSNNTLNMYDGTNFVTLGKVDTAEMGHATTASPSFTGTITSAGDILMSGNTALKLPVGNVSQRPTAATGQIRFNSELVQFEGYNGSGWGELANGVPAGAVFTHASTTVPSGFLECNGAAISRSTYASLFSKISTTWGSGDGSSTFNLPDLRGQFVRGWSNTKTGTGDDGRGFASSQGDQNKSHNHTAATASLTGTASKISETFITGSTSGVLGRGSNQTGSFTPSGVDSSPTGTLTIDASHTHNIASDGGTEVRVKNYALMYIIKF